MDNASVSRSFFSDAWHALAATKNLFGKLCLLTLIQFVPVLGQIVALGYFLGWAREAAWGMPTPLPDHVFGRGDEAFWSRGAKAFAVCILYALIAAFVSGLFTMGAVGIELAIRPDSTTGGIISGIGAVLAFLGTLVVLFVMYIGLVRLAVYNRFGAAFQWGACFKMLGHEFGGFSKMFWTFVLMCLIVGIPLSLVAGLLFTSMLCVGVDSTLLLVLTYGGFDGDVSSIVTSIVLLSIIMSAGTFVASFLMEVVILLVEAVSYRMLGNWTALFDVPSWGGRFDALPFERKDTVPAVEAVASAPVTDQAAADQSEASAEASASEAGAATAAPVEAEPTVSPADAAPLEKRCHPLLVAILTSLFALLVAAATSIGSLGILAMTYGTTLDANGLEELFTSAVEQISEELDNVILVDQGQNPFIADIKKITA